MNHDPIACIGRTLVAALALCAASALAAPQCSIAGPPTARLALAGSAIDLPALLEDCDGARVLTGDVTACVQDPRDRLDCHTYGTGAVLSRRELGEAGSQRGLLAALLRLLRGEATIQQTETRGADTGLPVGPVVLLSGHVDVDFDRPAFEGVQAVEFRDAASGRLVAVVRRTQAHRVPAAAFHEGHSYRWTLPSTVPALAQGGRFTIAARAALASAREEKRTIAASQPGATAQAFALAGWLEEQGLSYDARATLEAVGF